MKHILLLLIILMLCMVVPVGAESNSEMDAEYSTCKFVSSIKIIDPKGNNVGRPKMPKQYRCVELYTNKMKLFGQFDSSVLTMLSADGRQLYQVAIPQYADEVDIPVLSDVPVEVHINDGMNDYYGYIE